MKTSKSVRFLLGLFLAGWLTSGVSAWAQAGVSVSTVNGQTTVTWKGQTVFTGQTQGPVRAQSISVQGEEYAAAFAGDAVIWENVPGAAEKVKDAAKGPNGLPKNSGKHKQAATQSGLSVSTVNGETTVTWKGRQVFVGPTQGGVQARSKTINGKDFAAVFEGNKVRWENTPGAARQVK